MFPQALTFNDVLLIPAYSEVLPSQVKTKTRLGSKLELETPVLSAAMDTVTE
ncbi:MAG: IMP dehydrogenase, partial [Myxococcaceae bacterium]